MQLLSRRLGCCSCSCSERDCQKWSERYQRPPGPTNWQDRRPVRRSVAAWLSNWTQGVWQLPTTALWYSSRFTVSQPPGSFCIAKLTTLWPRFGEHVSHMHILLNEEKFGQVMALHTSGNGRQGLSLIGSMWYSVVSGIFFNFTKWQDDKSTFYLMNNALEKNISQKKKKLATSGKNKMLPLFMSHQLHDDMLSFLPKARCDTSLYDGNVWLFALLLLVLCFASFAPAEKQRRSSDHYLTNRWTAHSFQCKMM